MNKPTPAEKSEILAAHAAMHASLPFDRKLCVCDKCHTVCEGTDAVDADDFSVMTFVDGRWARKPEAVEVARVCRDCVRG